MRRLVDLGDRILLGTDFPNIPYPYLHASTRWSAWTSATTGCAAVFHDNADRLLGA